MGKVYNIVFRHLQQTGWDTLFLYIKTKKWRRAKPVIRRFVGDGVSAQQLRKYQWWLAYAYIRYGWNFDEFFMFNFLRLSHRGRKEFISETQREYFCRRVNAPDTLLLFTDKGKAYQCFAKYYRRDACIVKNWQQDEEAFVLFVERHELFLIKPLDGAMGNGVQIIKGEPADKLKLRLREEYSSGFIAEELIRQNEKMAVLHPSSVNTIRIATFRQGDKIHIVQPFVRMGRGDAIVDNAAQGGIFGIIDIDTGTITETSDEWGNKYVVHPDTGTPIVGYIIPEWKAALELAKELSGVVPTCQFVGWDFAYTDDGWVVVEGNSKAQFICFQTAPQKGYREKLEKMIGMSLKKFCRQQAS